MNTKEFRKYLTNLKRELVNDSQMWKALADIVNDERKQGFERSESPTGERWEPLAEKTIERKRKKGSKSPTMPLIDTGAMQKAVAGSTQTYGYVRLAAKRSEPVSGGDSISTIHHMGLGNVPRREHWGIYAKAIPRITRLFLLHIKEVLSRAN